MSTDPLAEWDSWAEPDADVVFDRTPKSSTRLRMFTPEQLAAHDAQVRADERQKVAALLADEGSVEKVEGVLSEHVAARGAFDHTCGTCVRERRRARAAIDVIAGLIGGEQ